MQILPLFKFVLPTLAARIRPAAVGMFCATALATTVHAERSYDAWQAKFDFTSTVSQGGTDVAVDSRGNVAVTGFTIDVNDGSKIFYTAKYAGTTGKPIWTKTLDLGAGDNFAKAVAVDSVGNVIVTGGANDSQGGVENIYTIKYAAEDGGVLWTKRYDGPNGGADEGTDVAVDAADNVVITGKSIGSGTNFDVYIAKYAGSNGGTLWERRFNHPTNRPDFPYALALDASGNVVVNGTADEGSDTKIYTGKYASANGAIIWEKTFLPVGTPSFFGGRGVAVDAAGNVFSTGKARTTRGDYSFHTIKYSAANGTVLWEKDFQSPTDDFNGPVGLVADSAGNCIVTGTSTLNNLKTTMYTAKYAAANGALLWEKRSLAPDGTDEAKAIAIDNADNVVVTGASDHVGSHDADYYTVKYNALDGRPLWEQRFVGNFRGGGEDTPAAVAVDDLGDVAITGVSTRPHPNQATGLTGFVTIKYQRLLGLTGDVVPGAGVAGSGVPANAKFSSIGSPAIADDGTVAALVGMAAGATRRTGILVDGGGKSFLPAIQGGVAPGLTGARYLAFYEPIIAPNGTYAFSAKLSGVPATKVGAVFTTAFNGTLQLALQQGTNYPALGAGVLVRAIASISLRNNQLVALVTLAGTGVTTANNVALLGINAGGTTLLLRSGQSVTAGAAPASDVTRISVLNPALGSNGHGRSQADGRVVAKVSLKDGRTVLLNIANGGFTVPFLFTGQDATTIAADAKWSTFGLPAIGSAGGNFVALGALDRTAGGITAATDTALVFSTNGAAFTDFAAENDPAAGIPNTVYTGFLDPVVNSNGAVAFIGTIRGTGVTAANQSALWFGTPGSLQVVARLGNRAPDGEGLQSTARFASLSSVALPGGTNAGPIFISKLAGAGVTVANNVALFGVDSTGLVRRLLRTGDLLGTRRVKSFRVLNAVSSAFGATRSFNTSSSVAVQVVFTKATSAVIAVGTP